MRRRTTAVVLTALLVGCASGEVGDADGKVGPPTDAEPSVDTEILTLDDAGFVATLAVPQMEEPLPAVLVLGGSEGGQPTEIGRLLAEEGYVTVALSYFAAPGLPEDLAGIPLEYFEHALHWLQERPEVDDGRVSVWGASRGGEAALLIGATYPQLVDAVVAAVPAHRVTCGLPDCDRPAWTVEGEPLTYVDDFSGPDAVPPEAEIPVEQIGGPVLLICGWDDHVWPSCPMSEAVVDRLEREGHPFDHELRAYGGAGHSVAIPPGWHHPEDEVTAGGGSPDANDEARADAWDATLEFFATHLS